MLIPLHVKSDHSLGYGTASPLQIVDTALQRGVSAIALTDLETLSGQVQFHLACRARGVKPIAGVELRAGFAGRGAWGDKRGRLVLLARDGAGYANLCRIVSARRLQSRTPLPDPVCGLRERSQGLFVLTDDASTLTRLLEQGFAREQLGYLRVRPNSAYSESERDAFALASEQRICVLADLDVVMLAADDYALHLMQVAIAAREEVASIRARHACESRERCWHSDARQLFADVPEALAASARLSAACTFDFACLGRTLPQVQLSAGQSADGELARRCRAQLPSAQSYAVRLECELQCLAQLGLSSYLLAVAQVVDEAKRRGIEVAGRGSAVGSLVAYLLGITSVDPVAQGLLFERFVHQGRRDLPDIDLDLPSDRRDELIGWVFEHFGESRVTMVSSLHTFQRRTAYREGGRALGMTERAIERALGTLSEDELDARVSSTRLPEPLRSALPLLERLIGRPHHLSVHPGGVVLAARPLAALAPLERAPKGVVVTQYDAQSVEALGLLKLDLLGNRCLSELAEAFRWCGGGSLAEIPRDDPLTLELIGKARTVGCFQLETPAVRSLLAKLPIRTLGDITAALALVRPGPASGETKASYVRRAHGEEGAEDVQPRLASVLAETYGLMLYEEDIVRVIRAVSGLSLAESDALRDRIVRGRLAEAELVGLAAEGGLEAAEAHAVWRDLSRFAAYSFSKAHASSYAWLAYASAYVKAHHPVELGCALLNHYGGMYPLRTIAAELVRMGVSVVGPSVQRSALSCSCEDGKIRIGLGRVKYLTQRAQAQLLATRVDQGPFSTLADFLSRVQLTSRELEALVLSGACDELAPLRKDDYPFMHQRILESIAVNPRADLDALHGSVRAARPDEEARLELYRALVRVQNELKILELHVSEHPMRLLHSEAERAGCIPSDRAAAHAGRTVRFAGIVSATRRLRLDDGRIMQFATFEDERGLLEAVVRPTTFAVLRDSIHSPGPYLLSGRVEEDHADLHLVVSELVPFHQRERPYA